MNSRWAVNLIGGLAFAGLLAGAVAGWIGVASRDGAVEVATTAASWRWLLFGFLVVAGGLRGWLDAGGLDRDAIPGAPLAAVMGAVGGAAGAALWLVAVMQVSGVFGGEDSGDVMTTARNLFGWDGAGIAIAAGVVGGIAGVITGQRRAR